MVGLDISTVPRVTNNEICRHAIQEQKWLKNSFWGDEKTAKAKMFRL
jgi:hypothetical protein